MTLVCPKCAADAEIDVQLNDGGMKCGSCEETFTADDVREFLAAVRKWRRVLVWVDAMPTDEEVEADAEAETAAA